MKKLESPIIQLYFPRTSFVFPYVYAELFIPHFAFSPPQSYFSQINNCSVRHLPGRLGPCASFFLPFPFHRCNILTLYHRSTPLNFTIEIFVLYVPKTFTPCLYCRYAPSPKAVTHRTTKSTPLCPLSPFPGDSHSHFDR